MSTDLYLKIQKQVDFEYKKTEVFERFSSKMNGETTFQSNNHSREVRAQSVSVSPDLWEFWFDGFCRAGFDTFQAVRTFGISEFLPRQIQNRNLHWTHLHARAASRLRAFQRIPLQAEEAESAQEG